MDMIFTDPPYNVNYKGSGKNTSRGIENDSMSDSMFETFLHDVFMRYSEITKKTAGVYVFHSTSTQAQFEHAMKISGFVVKNQLIWNKPSASMGWGDYRWKHEPFYY
jgi:DNA modification methylase